MSVDDTFDARVTQDVATMYDGPKMLDDMRAKAEAALAAGNEEAEKTAEAEFEAWKSRAPPAGFGRCGLSEIASGFRRRVGSARRPARPRRLPSR